MRVFISIDIPEKVKEEIKKIQDNLPEFLGKKTEVGKLHLTLKFLGEISEEEIKEIKKRLETINFEKFKAEINSMGVFSKEFLKIIWLDIKNCDELQREIDNILSDLFLKEKRFMSHLTIARVKNVENKKDFLEKLNQIKIPKINFIVENFKLKKSLLTNQGPDYQDIEIYSANKNIK